MISPFTNSSDEDNGVNTELNGVGLITQCRYKETEMEIYFQVKENP